MKLGSEARCRRCDEAFGNGPEQRFFEGEAHVSWTR